PYHLPRRTRLLPPGSPLNGFLATGSGPGHDRSQLGLTDQHANRAKGNTSCKVCCKLIVQDSFQVVWGTRHGLSSRNANWSRQLASGGFRGPTASPAESF